MERHRNRVGSIGLLIIMILSPVLMMGQESKIINRRGVDTLTYILDNDSSGMVRFLFIEQDDTLEMTYTDGIFTIPHLMVPDSLKLPGLTSSSSDTLVVRDGNKLKYRIASSGYWSKSGNVVYNEYDTVAVGNTSGDSLINVNGSGYFKDDIDVNGGWQSWTPTISWTGGTPTAPTVVARYNIVNNEVKFILFMYGENDSGFTLTGLNVTLPVTPADINAAVVVTCLYDYACGGACNSKLPLGAYINMINDTGTNRKLYISGTMSIADEETYVFSFDGKYEIN